MFTSKSLFSGTLCPHAESCVLPKCLFFHPEQSAKAAIPDKNQVKVGKKADCSDNGQAGGEAEHNANKAQKPAKLVPSAKSVGQSHTTKSLLSAHRDVSPPPIRRLESHSQNVTAKGKTPSAKAKTKPPAQTPSKPFKVESLNPRMVKHSPATHDFRYRLLKALHDQLVRLNKELKNDASSSEEPLVLSDQALIIMALDLEERAAVEKPSIYSNVVKNKLLVYKKMSVTDWKEERVKEVVRQKALKSVNASSQAAADPPKPIETGLSMEEELSFLPRLYTSIAGLTKHGYVSSVPSEEEVHQAKKGMEAAKGWEVCDRCKARFQVFPGRREEDGALTSGGSCTFHWGKPYWQEKPPDDPKATRQRKYRCCGQSMGDSMGCTTAESHVFKVSEVKRLAAVFNFRETPSNKSPSKRPVCFDCEMGYTVHGLELIRLTATAWPGGEELLDVLVRPIGEVLDLNSRWSGVWPEQIADAVPWDSDQDSIADISASNQSSESKQKLRIVSSPAAARSLLFKHLSPQTPLIGHGLENDLNAVRIIHPTLIDTALLFPHKAGLPYRNGLKTLMLTHLRRHIQVVNEDKLEGHDSKEDARAAGDLTRWKIGDEWQALKRKGWKLDKGQFIPPPTKGLENKFSVDFLEKETSDQDGKPSNGGSSAEAAKSRRKRPLTEISRDDTE